MFWKNEKLLNIECSGDIEFYCKRFNEERYDIRYEYSMTVKLPQLNREIFIKHYFYDGHGCYEEEIDCQRNIALLYGGIEKQTKQYMSLLKIDIEKELVKMLEFEELEKLIKENKNRKMFLKLSINPKPNSELVQFLEEKEDDNV